MKTEDNPSAFPQTTLEECRDGVTNVTDPKQPGMSLRDYFAAKAMGQLIDHKERLLGTGEHEGADAEWAVATAAYLQADAMLKARSA